MPEYCGASADGFLATCYRAIPRSDEAPGQHGRLHDARLSLPEVQGVRLDPWQEKDRRAVRVREARSSMTGKSSRAKGARGQSQFKNVLLARDWRCDSISAGIAAADLIATDREGKSWCVEIKNCAVISSAHKRQAIAQAAGRRLPWMLASKIQGSSSWLVQRQGERPVVWHEGKGE